MSVQSRNICRDTHIRRTARHVQSLFHSDTALDQQTFADLIIGIVTAPQLIRQIPDLQVGPRIILITGRTARRRSKDDTALLDQALDLPEQFRTHGLQLRQHEYFVLCAVRQSKDAILDRERILDHVRVDVIELVSLRQSRIGNACHLGRVLTNEISHIGHIQTGLKDKIHTAQILIENMELRIPAAEAVELTAEPGIDTRLSVFIRLLDVNVQQRAVDALGEETVTARLHHFGITGEHLRTGGKGFSPDPLLAVDMTAGRGSAVLDVAQCTREPIFTADLIGLASV